MCFMIKIMLMHEKGDIKVRLRCERVFRQMGGQLLKVGLPTQLAMHEERKTFGSCNINSTRIKQYN